MSLLGLRGTPSLSDHNLEAGGYLTGESEESYNGSAAGCWFPVEKASMSNFDSNAV